MRTCQPFSASSSGRRVTRSLSGVISYLVQVYTNVFVSSIIFKKFRKTFEAVIYCFCIIILSFYSNSFSVKNCKLVNIVSLYPILLLSFISVLDLYQ